MIANALLRATPWAEVRSILGSSSSVPAAVEHLLASNDAASATDAYWRLDNRVVVQGQLFPAAADVIGPLLTAIAAGLADAARHRAVDLLVEIANGQPDESEIELGNDGLAILCRERLMNGLWIVYSLLDDPVVPVRLGALDLLDIIEPDRSRLAAVIDVVRLQDPDQRVRGRAAEMGT